MFQVKVSITDDSASIERVLTDRMEAMRIWISERRFEPATFRYQFEHPTIACLVYFPIETEAAGFAKAFDGEMVSASYLAI
jgi:hypothetical protein